MSEKISFQTNIPVEMGLQFLEGKPVDSQFGGVQHLYSTTDNRVFFVSEMVGNIIADQLKRLGVQKGEPIEICKAEVTQAAAGKESNGLSRKWVWRPVSSPTARSWCRHRQKVLWSANSGSRSPPQPTANPARVR